MASTVGGEVVWNLDINATKFTEKINKARNKVGNFVADINASSNSIKTSFSSIGKSITGFALKGILGLGAGIATATGFAVKGASDLQNMRSSFDVLLGSAKEGQKLFKKLQNFALVSPFSLDVLSKSSQTMLGFGVNIKDVNKVLPVLGDISLGNSERLEQLSLAFAQVSSTGRLTGQDLLQFINAGFNPLESISKKTGKSIKQLKEEMGKGLGPTVKQVQEAMIGATSAGGRFFKGTEQGSKTLSGRFNSLKETIANTAFEVIGLSATGDIIKGSFFDKLSEGLNTVIIFLEKNKEQIVSFGKQFLDFTLNAGVKFIDIIQKISKFIINNKEIVLGAVGALALFVAGITVVSGIVAAVGFVISNLGTIISVGLVGAIGASIGIIIKNFRLAREQASLLFDEFKNSIKSLIERFKKIPSQIAEALKGAGDAIVKPFLDAKNKLGEITDNIKDKLDKINPFHRESPSLVDNVESGVGKIKSMYKNLGTLQLPSIADIGSKLDISNSDRDRSINITNNNNFNRDSDQNSFSKKLAWELSTI